MATADRPEVEVQLRDEWLARLADLVDQVEGWAYALGWSTRRVFKPMSEPEIGPYSAPGLLMQEDFVRVLLEPVTRISVIGESLVELYVMPRYDQIAAIFHDPVRGWTIMNADDWGKDRDREIASRPLTAEAFKEALAGLSEHVQDD